MNFFIGLLITLGIPITLAATWDYSDPDGEWPVDFPLCNGTVQSPINIDTDNVTGMDFSTFEFSIGYKFVQKGPLINNGHTLHYSADESMGASISGGPLNDSYTLNQFHLHWGSVRGQGSEHTVNGQSFDAELHFVHYKSTFDNISAAVASNESDALAVVGILMQEASPWDQYLAGKPPQSDEMLRKSALELSRPWRGPGAPSVELEVVPDQFISEITDLTGFYHYTGSLTTPGCAQIVQWFVLDKPLHVNKNFLAALRKNVDYDGNAVVDNYRPPQALNGRTVYHHEIVNMAGGGGAGAPTAAPGPCFHSGSYPDIGLTGLDGLTFVTLSGHPELTGDDAGAEGCQVLCAAEATCNHWQMGCSSATFCLCTLYAETWDSLPSKDTWTDLPDGNLDWKGPKTGCQ